LSTRLVQAEDRVHRIGQESNSVNIQFLLVSKHMHAHMYVRTQSAAEHDLNVAAELVSAPAPWQDAPA